MPLMRPPQSRRGVVVPMPTEQEVASRTDALRLRIAHLREHMSAAIARSAAGAATATAAGAGVSVSDRSEAREGHAGCVHPVDFEGCSVLTGAARRRSTPVRSLNRSGIQHVRRMRLR
jgi:hypothetical protein